MKKNDWGQVLEEDLPGSFFILFFLEGAIYRGGVEMEGKSFQNCQAKKATVNDWKIMFLLPWYKFSLSLNFCPNIWKVKHSPPFFKVVGGTGFDEIWS